MFTRTGFGHYIHVIWRHLWLILIVVALCTGTTLLINKRIPPVYEASALIQVHDTQTSNNNVYTDQALAQSYALLINQPEVLSIVAQDIPGLTLRQLTSQVSDSPLDNTQIIQVRATANNPEQAATIANTVTQVFIKLQTDKIIAQLRTTAGKLGQSLTKAKQAIDNDQANLTLLQQNNASADRIAHQNDLINNDQINYNSLQTSYNQVQQQILQVPNTLTVAQAATPPTTSNSSTLTSTLVATSLSLLIMLIFVFLLDWMDTTIKTPADIEHILHLQVLGSIPRRKKATQQVENEITVNVPLVQDEAIQQAFIGITSYFAINRQGKQTIVITGIHSKAGSSTVAANLALTLAQGGLRVLLIDANVNNPSQHYHFKAHPSTKGLGLSTTLTDHNWQATINSSQVYNWLAQWQTYIPNLWFLPAGPEFHNKPQ